MVQKTSLYFLLLAICRVDVLGNDQQSEEEEQQYPCEDDSQCERDEFCGEGYCVSFCVVCSSNTDCYIAEDDTPICQCSIGFIGNPLEGCVEGSQPQCKDRDDCQEYEECLNHVCVSHERWSLRYQNMECQDLHNIHTCTCKNGFEYVNKASCQPYVPIECTDDSHCPDLLACLNSQCVDPCPGPCGANTECHVSNHNRNCVCKHGYYGDPLQGCQPLECMSSAQCEEHQLCWENHCMDACPGPCGDNSECQVYNHFPHCVCKHRHSGNPILGCKPEECTQNEHCPDHLACRNFKCVSPCEGVCGGGSECRVSHHHPSCACNIGFIGDPFINCIPIPEKSNTKKVFSLSLTGRNNWATWDDAFNFCHKENSELATIENEDEQKEVTKIIKQRPGAFSYWIGGKATDHKTVAWVSNSRPLIYENFHNKPDSLIQNYHCVILNPMYSLKWTIDRCDKQRMYVCQQIVEIGKK